LAKNRQDRILGYRARRRKVDGAQISSGYPEQKHGLFTFYLLMGLQGDPEAEREALNELRGGIE